MSSDSLRTISITRQFDISAQRVFDAWLDTQKAAKWLFATPTGQMVRTEIDARVGGSFIFTDRREGQDVEHVGKYLEIDRPRRLVFSFSVPKFSKLSTTVSIDIKPTPSGCELTLTHEGVLPEYADSTQEGWGKLLSGLNANIDPNASFGVQVEPGTIRFERLLPGPIERVWEYLTDSEKRGKWFAAGNLEPRVGGTIELNFNHAKIAPDVPPEKYKHFVEKPGPFFKERITAYQPPRLLSWLWDAGVDGTSEVSFELTPQGHQVLLVLTQRRLADRQLADVAAGWHTHLAVLIDLLNGRQPQRFWGMLEEAESEYEKRLPVQ